MKYTLVLNGCSRTFLSQAEEMQGFIAANLKEPAAGNSIIFYCAEEQKPELIAHSPTPSLQLIKVERYQPETILQILQQLERGKNTVLYLFPSDFAGCECSVRFAYRMAGSSLVAVQKIEAEIHQLTCYKAVYANYLQGKFVLNKKPFCLSIAKGCSGDRSIPRKKVQELSEIDRTKAKESKFVCNYQFTAAEETGGLEQAKLLLVAGRGVKSKEKVDQLKIIAREIGAEFGVSRPVVMNAWAPLQKLVGVSGVITKPEVCLTAGVSGAAAFFAGIEKSKRIIAINTDEKAPLVQASDVAIIDDYEAVLDELIKIIDRSPKIRPLVKGGNADG